MSKYLSEYQCEYCFASLRPGEVCGCAAAQSDLAEIKARYPTNKIGRLYYDFLRIQKENIQRNDKIAALEKELAGGREEMNPEWVAWAKEEIISLSKIVQEKNAEIAMLREREKQAEERGARRLAEYIVNVSEHQATSVEHLMAIWRTLK